MALDPSVIIPAPQQQINPLQLLSQVQGLRNSQSENQLLQNSNQQFQLKQQAGNLLTSAIASNTDQQGNINYGAVRNALMQGAGNNPYVGEELQSNLSAQGSDLSNQRSAQGLSQDKITTLRANHGVVMGALDGLLSKPNLTRDDVVSAVTDLTSNPDLDQDTRRNLIKEGIGTLASIPENASDTQVRQVVKQQQGMLLNAEQQFNAVYGSPASVNTGAATTFQNINPVQGTVTPMAGPNGQPAAIANQLSPSELASRVGAVDPATGAPISVPQSSLVTPSGQPKGTGVIQTGLVPGQGETAVANAGRVQAIQHAALTAPTRLAAMQDVRSVVDAAPGTAFGPTSDLTSKLGKLGAAFGISTPGMKNGQASIEELNKSLTLIASQQGLELGAGTDASRAMVHDSNPSLANSKEGLLRNLAVVQGNELYAVAKNRALQQAQSNGLPASRAPQFETAFNKEVTPLVFQTHFMAPAAQADVFNSLSGTKNKDGSYSGQKGAFLKALDKAQHYGWFEGQ